MPLPNLEFDQVWWLALLPLGVIPFFGRVSDEAAYSWIELLPRDPLASIVQWTVRLGAAAVIVAAIIGLAGIHIPEVAVQRIARGAEIVVLLDKSQSMDQAMVPARIPNRQAHVSGFPTKEEMAARLLKQFAAGRRNDAFAMVMFSDAPIASIPFTFTRRPAVVQGGIDAAAIGVGLGGTNMVRGILAAAALFEGRPYAGSRVILMVSDGAAELDADARQQIATSLRRLKIRLSWIFLRAPGDAGLRGSPSPTGGADALPQQLDAYFRGVGIPYNAYEAEDRTSLQRAIDDIGRGERSPIQFTELLPRRELASYFFSASAVGAALLLVVMLGVGRTWA